MLRLGELTILESKEGLKAIPQGKVLINTINAHSFNTAQKDVLFAEALKNGDYLIPDGASIVKACRWLKCPSQPKERIAGWDLFEFEMERLNRMGGRCMFMGSSPRVLELIVEKAKASGLLSGDSLNFRLVYPEYFASADSSSYIWQTSDIYTIELDKDLNTW